MNAQHNALVRVLQWFSPPIFFLLYAISLHIHAAEYEIKIAQGAPTPGGFPPSGWGAPTPGGFPPAGGGAPTPGGFPPAGGGAPEPLIAYPGRIRPAPIEASLVREDFKLFVEKQEGSAIYPHIIIRVDYSDGYSEKFETQLLRRVDAERDAVLQAEQRINGERGPTFRARAEKLLICGFRTANQPIIATSNRTRPR